MLIRLVLDLQMAHQTGQVGCTCADGSDARKVVGESANLDGKLLAKKGLRY
jgi:hypothetical protein